VTLVLVIYSLKAHKDNKKHPILAWPDGSSESVSESTNYDNNNVELMMITSHKCGHENTTKSVNHAEF